MKTNFSANIDHSQLSEFNWQVRVYYEDTDAGGVVYHTNYLKYMERARTEWLRSGGFSQPDLVRRFAVVFVVANLSIDFQLPARFDELLDVNSRIISMGGSKIQFEQSIINADGELKCTAEITIVCVDSSTFKPKRIPDEIKAELLHDS